MKNIIETDLIIMRKNLLVLLLCLLLSSCIQAKGEQGDIYVFTGQGENWTAELRANNIANIASEGKSAVEMTLTVDYKGDLQDLEDGGELFFEAAWKYKEDKQGYMVESSNESYVASSSHGVNHVLRKGNVNKNDFVVSYNDPHFKPESELLEVTATVKWNDQEETFLLDKK